MGNRARQFELTPGDDWEASFLSLVDYARHLEERIESLEAQTPRMLPRGFRFFASGGSVGVKKVSSGGSQIVAGPL